MNIVGIVPARMASTRFPGKPLVKISGIPMIAHVCLRSKLCLVLSDVYVATCDEEVLLYAESIGIKAVMTSHKHERASDRTAEAMLKIENETGRKIDLVVMIQGDEPMLFPEMIEEAIKPMLLDNSIEAVNLMSIIRSPDEYNDPNTVKVVVDLNNNALYYSREPIPSMKKTKEKIKNIYKQVPIIPFRREFLLKFNKLPASPLEIIESVDMLRILEHGYKIKMILSTCQTQSVDTPKDLKKVEALMKTDKLLAEYSQGILK